MYNEKTCIENAPTFGEFPRVIRPLVMWLNRITSPEGCTAVDARKLKGYNHGLADERLTRKLHELVELPHCKCGLIPKTRTRSEDLDWGFDEFQFIECECGMRTVEKDFVYNRNENLQALIEIWGQPND